MSSPTSSPGPTGSILLDRWSRRLLPGAVFPESVRVWRSRAIVSIVLGLVGGVALSVYAVFFQAMNDMARSGCDGGGCEARLDANGARYQSLLLLGLLVGGGLVVVGSAVLVRTKRYRQPTEPVLPLASVTKRRD